MNIGEINTVQDLMNLDVEVKFSENFISLVKNYSTLVVIEFPEETFNLTSIIKEKVKRNIIMIENDEYVDLEDKLDDLKEILNLL